MTESSSGITAGPTVRPSGLAPLAQACSNSARSSPGGSAQLNSRPTDRLQTITLDPEGGAAGNAWIVVYFDAGAPRAFRTAADGEDDPRRRSSYESEVDTRGGAPGPLFGRPSGFSFPHFLTDSDVDALLRWLDVLSERGHRAVSTVRQRTFDVEVQAPTIPRECVESVLQIRSTHILAETWRVRSPQR
jgi:hypothetical protein